MSVSEISTSSSVLLQWQNGQLSGSGEQGTKSAAAAAQSVYANGTSMTDQVAGMVELTKYAMEAMGLASDSRVTFSQITKYRDTLLSEFNQSVKDGLTALGVSDAQSLKFTLQANDDGTLTVAGDCGDLEKIQNFFDNNPELVKKFQQIEALNGIDAAREALSLSPSEMRRRIEIESLSAWWAGLEESSSTFGTYSDQGLSLLSGINLTV
ncbi:MAG: hypothetical protein LBR31_03655 [Desulfovibrio sp.]|jgi:hypothetical protein|nr:hypothetical protein [Desulfovibrio sp.]